MNGAEFVFGVLVKKEVLDDIFGPGNSFIFMFKIMPTIIFVAVLVSIAYHIGLMQRVVAVFARGMKWIMNVSGSEALSNVSSAFVGQVEAQILIKPYINGMDYERADGIDGREHGLYRRRCDGSLYIDGCARAIPPCRQHHGSARRSCDLQDHVSRNPGIGNERTGET
jgi:hypothetical protein